MCCYLKWTVCAVAFGFMYVVIVYVFLKLCKEAAILRLYQDSRYKIQEVLIYVVFQTVQH
jgi:hypothetical protein